MRIIKTKPFGVLVKVILVASDVVILLKIWPPN